MNTAILLNRSNLAEMTQFSSEIAARQTASNQGKLLVLAAYYLDDEALQEIGTNLKGCFEVVELSKVQVGEKTTDASQLATCMAVFLMQRYTSVPGAWLVLDSRTEITQDNPLSIIEHHHNANRTDNSGRATTLGGGRVPVGPVVLGAPVKKLRSLRFVAGQDWRQRGRWVFNVCSWNQLTPEQYPFRLPSVLENPATTAVPDVAASPGSSPLRPGVKEDPTQPRKSLPISRSGRQTPPEKTTDGMRPVAMADVQSGSEEDLVIKAALAADKTPQQIYAEAQAGKAAGIPVPGDPDYIPPTRDLTQEELDSIPQHPGAALEDEDPPPVASTQTEKHRPASKPFVRVDPSAYEKVSREILLEQVIHRSGKAPHPATGEKKLIAKLVELDEAAALAGKQ